MNKNKRKSIALASSLLLASFLAVSINRAFSSPYIANGADPFNIGISGIKLGNADYYLFFNNGDAEALYDDNGDGTYTTTINTTEAISSCSYKITDSFGKEIYSSSSFDLDITGAFDLSFDASNAASSLTYSLSLTDEGNAFGASSAALPYCFFNEESVSRVSWWVVGQYSDNESDKWWSQSTGGIRMIAHSTNYGYAPHVYLPAGSQFKIYNGDTYKTYYGTNSFAGGDAVGDFKENNTSYSGSSWEGNNIEVKSDAGGYYDIYFNSECKIYINKSVAQMADSFDSPSNTSTFTIDATKYASSSTYLSFSNYGSSKVTQGFSVGELSAARSALVLKKYLYLDANVWNKDSATFKTYIWKDGDSTSSTICKDLSVYPSGDSSSSLFRINEPISTKYDYTNFKRCDSTGANEWNDTGDISLGDNCAFKITGWGSDKQCPYEVISSAYPEYIVTLNS